MLEEVTVKKVDGSITSKELEKLYSFIFFLDSKKSKTKVLFRGESHQNMQSKLNLGSKIDFSKIYKFIFLIGEKGRIFRQEFKSKIKDKSKIYSLNDVSDTLINRIFKKYHNLFSSKNNHIEVYKFKKDNPRFSMYFSCNKNKEHFFNVIQSSKDVAMRLKIRDYYLSLLHRIGGLGFFNNSFFVSTTMDFDTAEHFANHENPEDAYIIVSWVTYPINRVGVNFNYLNRTNEIIKKLDLPVYTKSFFQHQKEVTIKGGILPTFILGIVNVRKNEFVVNPNFLNCQKSFRELSQFGIDINQSNFHEKLEQTDYSGYFAINEDAKIFDSIKTN